MKLVPKLLALLLLTAAQAQIAQGHAATAQDYEDCNAGDADERIAACTRIIDDPQEPVCNRGLAYYARGLGHIQKKQDDLAIANLDAAIRLIPSYAPAFINRGSTLINKREYDRAIADFDQALQIDPDNTLGYYFRGW